MSALAFAVSLSACAGFEHRSERLSPTAPDLPSIESVAGALTGVWSSTAPLGNPNSWTCGNFQWSIGSQTSSSLAGEFAAVCAGIVLVQGQASGQLNGAGTEVALRLTGTATAQGIITCPFELSGTGYITDGGNTMRLPYSGTTCFGPIHGEETIRRPAANEPPPPPPSVPDPDPEPVSSSNPNHVADGPLSAERAEQVVYATGREFPNLTAPPGSESEGIERAEELLLRTIWHLRLAGFEAGRQRNPSGAISNDKLTIQIDGTWRAFDIFRDLGHPGVPIDLTFFEVFPAGHVSYPGIGD
jgi:hypothetical protein